MKNKLLGIFLLLIIQPAYAVESENECPFGNEYKDSNNSEERSKAIESMHDGWFRGHNVVCAAEEGNLLVRDGVSKNWEAIRHAYEFFLSAASNEQKNRYKEVENNLKLTNQYKVNQQLAAKRERQRIAREGDGSDDDETCKGYGAKPGTQPYINCRIQLRQLSDQAARDQDRAEQEQSAHEENIRRIEADRKAQRAEQNRRAAAEAERRHWKEVEKAGLQMYRNAQPKPPPKSVNTDCISDGVYTSCTSR